MEFDSQFAYWGLLFAAMMYVIGNGLWANHAARQRQWLGWLMWSLSAIAVILLAAAIETQLDSAGSGVWERISRVDGENHWIAVSLYALMSVPGAASVIFKQNEQWTRMALLIPAIIVFIPAGMRLGSEGGNIAAGLGLTAVVCSLVIAWQALLDKVEAV